MFIESIITKACSISRCQSIDPVLPGEVLPNGSHETEGRNHKVGGIRVKGGEGCVG